MRPAGLLILGFGGHARSVADVALAGGIEHLRFVDANARPGETLAGFPVAPRLDCPLPEGWLIFPAAGDNGLRADQVSAVADPKLLHTLISPRAYIGLLAAVGRGTLVGHQAHLGPMSVIGAGCIINTGAIVDHESTVGDYCHISVNSTIAGRCRIGKRSFIGAGAIVIDGMDIGDDITVGAGSVVVRSLQDPGTYVGNPARRLR